MRQIGLRFKTARAKSKEKAYRQFIDDVMGNLSIMATKYDLDKILDWILKAEDFLKGETALNRGGQKSATEVLRDFLNEPLPPSRAAHNKTA